jgi:hypothetical protein
MAKRSLREDMERLVAHLEATNAHVTEFRRRLAPGNLAS